MEKILEYLNEDISDKDFFDFLYKDETLQGILENETKIPPYTNNGSLLLYLLSGNYKDLRFLTNVKSSLRQFLEKNNIMPKNDSNRTSELYNIILEIQPKWLDISPQYFSDILEKYNGKNKKEIKEELKKKIDHDFVSLKNKPRWLQGANWPIENGKPLIFIGELDISDVSNDISKAFVFFNTEFKNFHCIKQSL